MSYHSPRCLFAYVCWQPARAVLCYRQHSLRSVSGNSEFCTAHDEFTGRPSHSENAANTVGLIRPATSVQLYFPSHQSSIIEEQANTHQPQSTLVLDQNRPLSHIMCYRTDNHYECGHAEVVTTRCRGPWSNIIPRRCLPGFKLPTKNDAKGRCTSCSIYFENKRRRLRIERDQAR
jgi:hypothetical protein